MRPRARSVLLLVVAAAALAGCSDGASGVAAYRDGRFDEAQRLLDAAVASAGEGAGGELLYAQALAALRNGDLDGAERASRRLAALPDSSLRARGDFLLGNVAFARCRVAERQASGPEAEPFALQVALLHAENALRAWERAAASRDDWPEARRNVQRAWIDAESLRNRSPSSGDRRRTGTPEVRLRPAPSKGSERPTKGESPKTPAAADDGAAAKGRVAELPPGEVLKVLDRLAEKEREKLAARRARRDAGRPDVERDW